MKICFQTFCCTAQHANKYATFGKFSASYRRNFQFPGANDLRLYAYDIGMRKTNNKKPNCR